jgi:putative hemolysin
LVDEFGGTAGIVTLEDLVEALVGPIAEEPLARSAPAEGATAPDGSLLLDGLTRIDELEELIGERLPERLRDEVETVGGLVTAVLGRIPDVGEAAAVAGRTLRVEAREGLRVAAVRVLPGGPAGSDRSGVAVGLGLPAGLLVEDANGALAAVAREAAAVLVALGALV